MLPFLDATWARISSVILSTYKEVKVSSCCAWNTVEKGLLNVNVALYLKTFFFLIHFSFFVLSFFVHISDLTEWHVSSAALALVDGEPWHMHRPLTRSCSLTLLTFKDANPQLVNQVLKLCWNVVNLRCISANNIYQRTSFCVRRIGAPVQPC